MVTERCVVWSRNDVTAFGSRTKYSELSAATRSTLSTAPPHIVTADRDDQPLSLIDGLKSTPAAPVEILSSAVQQPTQQSRYLISCLHM